MNILGIGGILGDAACAILDNGTLVAAIEESKLSRQGLKPGAHAGVTRTARAIYRRLPLAGRGLLRNRWMPWPSCVRSPPGPEAPLHLQLRVRFPNSRIVVVEHHTAHAASAYFPSPFDDATVLTLDRAGDFRCGTPLARGKAPSLRSNGSSIIPIPWASFTGA